MISFFISSAYNTNIFKTNTCASFKNRLPRLEDTLPSKDRRNNVNKSYSISITDLYYPSMIFNVSEKGNGISFVHIDDDNDIVNVSIQ